MLYNAVSVLFLGAQLAFSLPTDPLVPSQQDLITLKARQITPVHTYGEDWEVNATRTWDPNTKVVWYKTLGNVGLAVAFPSTTTATATPDQLLQWMAEFKREYVDPSAKALPEEGRDEQDWPEDHINYMTDDFWIFLAPFFDERYKRTFWLTVGALKAACALFEDFVRDKASQQQTFPELELRIVSQQHGFSYAQGSFSYKGDRLGGALDENGNSTSEPLSARDVSKTTVENRSKVKRLDEPVLLNPATNFSVTTPTLNDTTNAIWHKTLGDFTLELIVDPLQKAWLQRNLYLKFLHNLQATYVNAIVRETPPDQRASTQWPDKYISYKALGISIYLGPKKRIWPFKTTVFSVSEVQAFADMLEQFVTGWSHGKMIPPLQFRISMVNVEGKIADGRIGLSWTDPIDVLA